MSGLVNIMTCNLLIYKSYCVIQLVISNLEIYRLNLSGPDNC